MTLTLKENTLYRTRDGRIVGPLTWCGSGLIASPRIDPTEHFDYYPDGRYRFDPSDLDIIEELGATIPFVVGRDYMTRDGRRVTCKDVGSQTSEFRDGPWVLRVWTATGRKLKGVGLVEHDTPFDIVAIAEDKITREELVSLFGDLIPIEAVQIVWHGDPGTTVAEARAKLQEIAASPKDIARQIVNLFDVGDQRDFYIPRVETVLTKMNTSDQRETMYRENARIRELEHALLKIIGSSDLLTIHRLAKDQTK